MILSWNTPVYIVVITLAYKELCKKAITKYHLYIQNKSQVKSNKRKYKTVFIINIFVITTNIISLLFVYSFRNLKKKYI